MGLLKMIEEAAIPAHESLMVGDSSVDIATARNAGVRTCGVLWGFQPETFAGVAPDFTIAHPGELAGASPQRTPTKLVAKAVCKLCVSSSDGNLSPELVLPSREHENVTSPCLQGIAFSRS